MTAPRLCVGLLLIEFFYFSVHPVILFDIPGIACILILALFMLNKKWVLYAIQSIYGAALLYQWLVLRTISRWVPPLNIFRLVLGAAVVFGGAALADYWIEVIMYSFLAGFRVPSTISV